MNLREKVKDFPDSPGVYLMKEASGKVIYVGKAKSLKKRVGSYFGRDLETKTMVMMSHVADIEYRLSPSEAMALLLEGGLVHQYMPRYNVALRDDKSFPFVKITNEEFPRICITRKKEDDGSLYLGRYTSAGLLRQVLKSIRRYFPYRSCRKFPTKPCIYYRLGLSPAPCAGKILKVDYAKIIANVILILKGRSEELIKELTVRMHELAGQKRFEEAAKIRDQIAAISAIGSSRAGASYRDELEDLKILLGLKEEPLRIEAFDISNTYGKEATGSMVSFLRGWPDKDNYRKFRIRTVGQIDDYGMLKEVLLRRYKRVTEERLARPDLILIDGGKSHLSVAKKAISELSLEIPLVSIAKKEENIYTTSKRAPVKFDADTPALNLIRRIRDEAHRFAVSYHHVLRRKKIIGR